MLFTSLKKAIVARWLYLALFGWAAYVNITNAYQAPTVYLDYANFALLPFYRSFILGFFSRHIKVIVSPVALCQLIVSISMLLKGNIFRLGCLGGMIFLVAITPLGVGAAFPATLTMAAGLYRLRNKSSNAGFLWQKDKKTAKQY